MGMTTTTVGETLDQRLHPRMLRRTRTRIAVVMMSFIHHWLAVTWTNLGFYVTWANIFIDGDDNDNGWRDPGSATPSTDASQEENQDHSRHDVLHSPLVSSHMD
ncbi:uncharacterized protein LOC112904066 isoform X3 [Agrilus planipennis]|uniref:Uncharacterized protein LOC112904066 isoform X3 n=1 Tax=Agrilus planipennis TaxID=224129 RepID=A0A7F5QVG1_AGRPL|nr:uncharacterized protein LOC112904066 isoform X3 [Agrilus planipennis]